MAPILHIPLSFHYLYDPNLRQMAFKFVLLAFSALLFFYSYKSLYVGEINTFTASEGEVKSDGKKIHGFSGEAGYLKCY